MKNSSLLTTLAVVLVVVVGVYAIKNHSGNNNTEPSSASTEAPKSVDKAENSANKDSKDASKDAAKDAAAKDPAVKDAPKDATKDAAKDTAAKSPDNANDKVSDDQVVGKYNGISITRGEINQKIKDMNGGKLPDGKTDINQFSKEMQQNIVKGIITGKLVSAEAEKLKLDDDEKVKRQLATIKEQVIQQEFISRKMKEAVTEAQVKEKYAAFAKEESDKEEVKARHILVESEDDAKKVEADLKKGKDFYEVAKQYSIDKSNKDKGGD